MSTAAVDRAVEERIYETAICPLLCKLLALLGVQQYLISFCPLCLPTGAYPQTARHLPTPTTATIAKRYSTLIALAMATFIIARPTAVITCRHLSTRVLQRRARCSQPYCANRQAPRHASREHVLPVHNVAANESLKVGSHRPTAEYVDGLGETRCVEHEGYARNVHRAVLGRPVNELSDIC
ncbi:hypothetical protein P153DRAFT_391371 [Dothidotthia symphoricarpi CBS 119687]|uniref:Uncharacterized protein n=1 Tax=Dothidotthia symphoricarpi CBS 119687 TaxID=1392245 RepID=A0A6A5ZX94_9PLEO|nr:uncharacterized protein P153DRAFT_391371 [Dothidotthia symphoricarpi CBS 119687]KAF2123645.1 hypothetical protein P153DRAFT_391371 [Dothidotthia symphoricarpi CBS 119687]